MPKIIHIADFDNIKKTGIGEVVLSLKKTQEDLGNEVFIFNIRRPSQALDQNQYYISSFKVFKQYLFQIKPDVIIFHSLYKLNYFIYFLYLKNKYPYLIQPHGGMTNESLKKGKYKKRICNFLILNKFIGSAKGIIFLNKNEQKENYFGNINSNYVLIPNGIWSLNKEKKTFSEEITLGFLARIDIFQKGLDILLDAILILSQDKSKLTNAFKLKIWGYGLDQDVEYLNNRIKSDGLGDLVSYEGPVFDDDKDEAYSMIDISILTSRIEGMPMGILEALSFGCPCLITKETNMADTIIKGHCGWITDLDASSIAQKIQVAISDYIINRDSFNANSWNTASSFLWTDIGEKSVDEYYKLIKS